MSTVGGSSDAGRPGPTSGDNPSDVQFGGTSGSPEPANQSISANKVH